jgi:hypothetical protein
MVMADDAVPVKELGYKVEVSAEAVAGIIIIIIDDVATQRGWCGS